ncbi:MAG TPA: hypothetical protein VGQ53_16360, partial [Chitinophagaceae bacterium]|nr:hypothetical protein [Chitinophagaceae bacterium]
MEFSSERDFFNKTIDLEAFADTFGFSYSKKKSERNQKHFVHEDEREVTINNNKSRKGYWLWCVPGSRRGENESGTITDFVLWANKLSTRESATEIIRQYAKKNYPVEASLFYNEKKQVERSQVKVQPKVYVEPYPEESSIRTFVVKPAEDFAFILNRGIKAETINHPLFKNKFGNATGPMAQESSSAISRIESENLLYEKHLLLPYTDANGRVVALEAKNKLTPAHYQRLVLEAASNGEKISDIRKNPSLFYEGSLKNIALWVSNIPENPTALFIAEQPLDCMAHFQMFEKENESTIYVATAGSPSHFQREMIKDIVNTYNIDVIKLGFDREPSGFKFSTDILLRTLGEHTSNDVIVRNGMLEIILSDKVTPLQLSSVDLEGETTYFPSVRKSDKQAGTLIAPYTPHNALQLFLLLRSLHPQGAKFEFLPPVNSKDWNDELNGEVENSFNAPLKFFLDTEGERNKLLINANDTVTIQRRSTSIDHNLQDQIGVLNPFAYTKFITTGNDILDPGIALLVKQANEEYAKMLPRLDERFTHFAATQGLSFDNGYFLKKEKAIAQWTPENGLVNLSEGELTKAEKIAMEWMTIAAEVKRNPNRPLINLKFREVYYGYYNNENLKFRDTSLFAEKTPIFQIGSGSLNRLNDHIPVDQSVKKELENAIQNYRLGKEFFLPAGWKMDKKNQTLTCDIKVGDIADGKLIPTNKYPLEKINTIVERSLRLIAEGKDPNKPGLIGVLDNRFNFQPSPWLKSDPLSKAGELQLGLLLSELDKLKPK